MAMSQQGFQLGILPERKIDKRAVATGYTFLVLVILLLINLGLVFPDRIQFKQYHVTALIPLPALKPEPEPAPAPCRSETRGGKGDSANAGFRAAENHRAAGSSRTQTRTGGST